MKNRNCPNCGAPYDMSINSCPYCGTSYFDLSSIDFSNREPIFLKIKINNYDKEMIITQKVIPELGAIEVSRNTVDITDNSGHVVKRYYSDSDVVTNINFRAIPNHKNEYFSVTETL